MVNPVTHTGTMTLDAAANATPVSEPDGLWRITVLIPARNEAACLPEVLREIPADLVHEILVVDGHSTDGTPDIVRSLNLPKVRLVTQQGRGFGMGIITGVRAATGNLITIYDGDGSYDPGGLSLMLAQIKNGYDFVYCSRYRPESGSDDDTLIRLVGNAIFTFLLRVMFRVQLTDALFYYCMGKKEAYNFIDPRAVDFSICVEVPIKMHRMGFKYTEIPMRERPRSAGESKVNALWDGIKILKTMIKLKLTGL